MGRVGRMQGAIITGAGSGINLALAKELHARGCAILIGDIALHHEAKQWLDSASVKGGPSVIFRETNVTAWDQLESLFDAFAQDIGGVPNLVVAGAGVYEASNNGFWDEQDEASHFKVLDINLVHPVKLTRIAIRRMQEAKSPGVILHESSIVALKPSPILPLYAISKAALSHFVRCMAPLGEMSGIKVVAVAPGVVDTPLFRDHPQAQEHIDMENDFLLPPEEVVKAMLALATDDKYVSGTVLEVNDIGGWREVQLLNDPGPQGRSKGARTKAGQAISIVQKALMRDAEGGTQRPKL